MFVLICYDLFQTYHEFTCTTGPLVAQMVKNLLAGDQDSIPGLEDPLENGLVIQYSCLENPMDRGDWQAIIYGVARSWTWLSN